MKNLIAGIGASAGGLEAAAQVCAHKVLIVDDHDLVRGSLSRLVKSWGHEVTVAVDGPSGLMLAQSVNPQYAIIDITLPGMSGIDLAQRLREIFSPAQLFLVAYTGRSSADMRAKCMDVGFDAFLVKPGDITELEELLGPKHRHLES